MFSYTFVEHSVEAYACLLSNHGRNDTAGSICRDLRVARYLLIPLLVSGVVILALVIRLRIVVSKKQGSSDEG